MEDDIFKLRQEKIKLFQEKGLEKYSPSLLKQRLPIGRVLQNFNEGATAVISGRLIAKRSHGKAMFWDLKDASGRIQLYIREKHRSG